MATGVYGGWAADSFGLNTMNPVLQVPIMIALTYGPDGSDRHGVDPDALPIGRP
jgi:hypothetical protein